MQMSTLLTAEPEANFADCSEARSLQVQHGLDDYLHRAELLEDETISEEFSSFQIRNFVSTVRRRDFSKCWPFRQKILEKCLSSGLKPFLPPFEPPLRGWENGEGEQVSPREEGDEFCEESKEGGCTNVDMACCAVSNEKLQAGDQQVGDVIGVTKSSGKDSDENHSAGTTLVKPACSIEGKSSQEAGITALEKSQDESDTEFEKHANEVYSDIGPSNCVDGTSDDGKTEVHVSTNAVNDLEARLSNHVESEAGSVHVIGPSFSDIKGSSLRKVQQHHKGKFKLLSDECPLVEEQAGSHKAKPLKAGMPGKVYQDESQLLSERLKNSDQVTASCIESDIVGLPTRLERTCRNGEDNTFIGLNLDSLVPQVCPVCLNFTSTSNTALNAHIDHCLESVLPGEKGESRACKSRIRPRKMRSMVDICATAPARTLEDLELSSKLWALNDEASKDDPSCSPSWKSGLVRRQPRTSLHRGLAWKARNSLDLEDAPQVSGFESQPQLEKSPEGNLATKQPILMKNWSRTRTMDTEFELEQSVKDQQSSPEEPFGPLHVASPMHNGKVSLARKKKKKGSTNVAATKEVLMSGGHCQSDEEQDDNSWSVPVNLLDFTPVDTSAEEEKRLQQKIRCAKGGETEVEKPEQQGYVEDFVSRSGKFFGKQFSNGSPSLDLTSGKSDNKSPNEVLKKRLRTQTDSDWILDSGEGSAEEVDIIAQVHSERPAKNKRAAPKIKSLLTVVANSRKEKANDGFEGLGSQKMLCTNDIQEKIHDEGVNSTPNGGLSSGYQEIRSKRKSLASMKVDTKEGCCERNKHARFRPSEQRSLSDNLDLDNLSDHAKSPKGSSATSGRALTEQDETCSVCPCPDEEMPQRTFVEEFDKGNMRGKGIGSLMSRLSNHQAGQEGSTCALEKRNILIANTNIEDLSVKTPPQSLDLSGMGENGTAHGRSRFESLRNTFFNVTSKKGCAINKEEGSRKMSNVPCFQDQAGKSNPPASQTLTGCNSVTSMSPFSTFSKVNSRENDSRCGPQLLPANRRPFFSEDVGNFRSVDNLRTNQMVYDSTAASNFHNSVARDNQGSLANLPPLWSDNPQLSVSALGSKVLKNNGQSLAAAESLENLGNCTLKSSGKQALRHASFLASDLYERKGLNGNEGSLSRQDVSILDNGNLFLANRIDQIQGHNCSEDLQRALRAANGTMGVELSHQSQQEYLGSRILSSELAPVILSSASEALQDSRHNHIRETNGHDYASLPTLSNERMSLPPSLLADLARNMAGNSMKAQNPSAQSSGFVGEQHNTPNSCFQCTPKNLNRAREYLNLMPLQGVGKSCHPSTSNGSVQPHLLHSTLQAMKGNASTLNSERVNCMGGNMDVPRKLRNTLSTASPFRVDPSNASVNGKRESLLGADLASSLNNYGTVEYPGDQGVVHIFGNPVFKLMGQNVIVTNNSIKALGMEGSCDQNGAQSFHSSSSIRHLGVLPETQNHYSHKLSQELFSSSRLEAWHGDSCMPISRSFMMDNVEIQPHALQNLPPTKSVHPKMPVYKDPVILKPQMPMCISGERSRISNSTREMMVKKPVVVNAVNKPPAEVFIDTLPSGGTSLSAALSRGSGIITQQTSRHFTASSCLLPRNEPLVQSQALTMQSTSTTYLVDVQKLDVTGCNTRYGSGTLADIVQSSERSNC
eukprot:c22958_g2_i2 orf=1254-6254(+)